MVLGERKDDVDVVRDEDAGAAADEKTVEEMFEKVACDMSVDGRKDVVKEDDGSRSVDGPCQRESRLLAAYSGQAGSAQHIRRATHSEGNARRTDR